MSFSNRIVFSQVLCAQPATGKGPAAAVVVFKPCSGCGAGSQTTPLLIIAPDIGPEEHQRARIDPGDPAELAALMAELVKHTENPVERQGAGAKEDDRGARRTALEQFRVSLNEMLEVVHEQQLALDKAPAGQLADRSASVPRPGLADRGDAGTDPPARRL